MISFRIWLNEAAKIIYVGGETFDDDNRDDFTNQAWKLAKNSSIHILSDKDLSSVAIINNVVVGALFVAWNQEEFSFDVVVDPKFQNQGIGKQLIDAAMSEFNWTEFPDKYIKADVVNSYLIPVLRRYGFKIQQQIGSHTIMTYGQNQQETL